MNLYSKNSLHCALKTSSFKSFIWNKQDKLKKFKGNNNYNLRLKINSKRVWMPKIEISLELKCLDKYSVITFKACAKLIAV